MTKSTIYQYITDAKRAHLAWVRKAEHLIEGLPVKEGMIPLDATTCTFGKWLYCDGSKLRMINNIDKTLDEIEKHHNELHYQYITIYKIFFVLPKQKSLFHRMITFNSKEPTRSDREQAVIHFKSLQKTSEYLLNAINNLERKVKDLNFTDINTMHS